MRNFECEKYSECLGYAAKKNISFKCDGCKDMSNFLVNISSIKVKPIKSKPIKVEKLFL